MGLAETTTAAPPRPQVLTRSFFLVGASLFFSSLALGMTLQSVSVFLHNDKGLSKSATGAYIAGVLLAAVVLRLPLGRMMDRFGAEIVGRAAGGCFVLAAVAFYASATFDLPTAADTFVLFVGLTALGGALAIFTVAAFTYLGNSAAAERRGEAIGYLGVVQSLVQGIGSPIAFWIFRTWSFSTLYVVVALMGVLSTVSFASLERLPDAVRPVEPRRRFVDRYIERSAFLPGGVGFCVTLCVGGIVVGVPLLGLARGIANPGLFFVAAAVMGILIRVLGGRLSDRYGRLYTAAPGFVLAALSLVAFALLPGTAGMMFAGAVWGLGTALAMPSLQTMVVDRSPPHRRGAANVTLWTAFDGGVAAGSFAYGGLAAAFGYEAALLALAGSPLLGLALLLAAARRGSLR